MKKLLLLMIAAGCGAALHAGEKSGSLSYPSATIKSGSLQASVFLPGGKSGYYSSSRFNWSGMISSVRSADHVYFTTWSHTHNPEINHAAGPADEFDPILPPGYAEARAGELFLKIGVGWLRKTTGEKYSPYNPIEIADAGKWRTARTKNSLTFTHDVPTKAGLGYVYGKKLTLTNATLVISQTLKNVGTKLISTSNYCHNFISIDKQPIGSSYQLALEPSVELSPAFPSGRLSKAGPLWTIQDGVTPGGAELIEQPLAGQSVTVINTLTKGRVRLTFQGPLEAIKLYMDKIAICPEPFVKLEVLPQREVSWSWTFEFQPPASKTTYAPQS